MRLVRLAPLVLALGCESVIGADFDAHPAEDGSAGTSAGSGGGAGAKGGAAGTAGTKAGSGGASGSSATGGAGAAGSVATGGAGAAAGTAGGGGAGVGGTGAAGGGTAGAGAGAAGQGGQGAQGSTSGQGGVGKGGGGQAGQGGSGQGGKGGSGQAGASQGLGGAAPTCPPSSFTGLPSCQQSAASECVACVCGDVNPQTLCPIAYKECLDDLACSKTVECLLRACSVSSCDPLAGASAAKVQKVIPCLTDTCGSTCKPLMSGTCVPKTCASSSSHRGMLDDGCGKQLDCGTCQAPLECGVSGPPNVCGCKPGEYTCLADQLRRCTPDGSSSYLVADCPAGQCNATNPAAGKCNSCTLGQVQCQGQQLMSCVDDGMGGEVLSPKGGACASGQICDPKTQDCDKCVPNSFYCVGASLRKCSADGQTSSFVSTCDSDALCAISVFTGECQPPVCGTGGGGGSGGAPALVCNSPPSFTGGACVTVDGAKNQCNPVSNDKCNTPTSEVCQPSSGGGYTCVKASPQQKLCEACGACNPCGAGLTCIAGKCARFCCDTTDCNGFKCDTSLVPGGAGVCVQ